MITEQEAWTRLSEAFDRFPVEDPEIYNLNGLCFALDSLWWYGHITEEIVNSMNAKIFSKLLPGEVYLAPYDKEGAVLRAAIAREFAQMS